MELRLKKQLLKNKSFYENKKIIGIINSNPYSSSIKAIKLGAVGLELRLDCFNLLDEQFLENIFTYLLSLKIPLILTLRSKNQGGFFSGSRKQYYEQLFKYINYVDYIDLEYQKKDKKIEYFIKKIKEKKKKIIFSVHFILKMPSYNILHRIYKFGIKLNVDMIKMACIVKKKKELVNFFDLGFKFKNKSLCLVPLGIYGSKYRHKVFQFKSVIAYCCINSCIDKNIQKIDEMIKNINIDFNNYAYKQKKYKS